MMNAAGEMVVAAKRMELDVQTVLALPVFS
jgi:hypothetical protein